MPAVSLSTVIISPRWASNYSDKALADAQWLYVDLQATYTVSQVRINWERAYGKEYEVQISADAQTWQTLRKITNNTQLINTISGLSGTGQYVRINCLARGTDYGYSIQELEVMSANAAPSVILVQPAANSTYTGPVRLSAFASDADGTVAKVDFYVDNVLVGSDPTSSYEVVWNTNSTGTHVAKAVATDNSGASTTSYEREFYTNNPPATNQPPTVGFILPQAADYPKPARITLTANASDADGTITQVAFYANTTLLNVDTTAPYAYTWTDGASGVYDLTAVATDNAGATTTSYARRVRILTDPPVVNITSPTAGGTVSNPVVISADVTDPDGTIETVEFYSYGSNQVLLKTFTGPGPYTYTWTNAAPGPRTILVQAVDNDGRSTSKLQDFIVAEPNTAGIGRVEAESYATQSGTQTELTADVGGGLNVGYLDAGDYLNYQFTATSGSYAVQFRVASWIDGAQLQLRTLSGPNGGATLATVTLPNTGGGQQWQTVTVNNVPLLNGEQTLQVLALTNGFNFNWMAFARTPQAGAQAPVATGPAGQSASPNSTLAGYPNPAMSTFYLPGVADGTPVIVRDAVGNQVRATVLRGGAIDVQALPTGLYLVQAGTGRQLKMLKQ